MADFGDVTATGMSFRTKATNTEDVVNRKMHVNVNLFAMDTAVWRSYSRENTDQWIEIWNTDLSRPTVKTSLVIKKTVMSWSDIYKL